MVKRISIIILSIAIISTGAFAFHKLNYWEKSVSIFSYKTANRHFEARGERGSGRSGDRGDYGRIPEFRERMDLREGSRPPGERSLPDSTEQQYRGSDREREGRTRLEAGGRDRGGHGRGGYSRGKKIRLRNVLWFLAVFALFTAISIYFDKAHIKIRKKKLRSF